jgi:thiamine monophosphate synthase
LRLPWSQSPDGSAESELACYVASGGPTWDEAISAAELNADEVAIVAQIMTKLIEY